MFDFIKAACAVPDVKPADITYNVEKIIEKCNEADENFTDIVVFPELSVCGYTCGDLFFQKELQLAVQRGIAAIARQSEQWEVTSVIGAPLVIAGCLYNCAVVIGKGRVYGIVPKTFIPNYMEFYEKRWFASACDLKDKCCCASSLGLEGLGGEDGYIPAGGDLLFDIAGEFCFGAEICEDLFAPVSPSSFLYMNGAHLVVNPCASNDIVGKRAMRRNYVKTASAKSAGAYALCCAGNGESTSDLVFTGHSLICENGAVAAENTNFVDNDYIMYADIDIGRLKADRLVKKSGAETAAVYGGFSCRKIFINARIRGNGENYRLKKLPFVPDSKTDRSKRCGEIFELQCAALGKRLDAVGGKLCINVSGGLDSTLALLVCAGVIKKANRPMTDITALTLPCYGTTDRTRSNALDLMNKLGVSVREIDIKDAVGRHLEDIGHGGAHDVTYENAQARERTQILLDMANQINGIAVGTGDLSESALGWCTYGGDHLSMYSVNAGIPKTLIRWIIEGIIEMKLFEECNGTLADIVNTPISPELLPPDEKGKILQVTEDIVGPYALHDFFLYYVIRFGFSPEKVYYLACKAFSSDFDAGTVLKWLKVFYRRFVSQQFKRSCMPDGAKIGSVGLSPRGDWRMPSDARAALWLEAAEKLG